ncbi:hypothetical protein ATEIFO6365_0008039500 [Aspergillus terreus]|uniref:Uncharacterized protein n=1 Tax=Aspergillus terreus TaxID=33178 RepID=A0A5M3Z706_ASPTE|nr:hypothetical protein ATETN484_0010040400 [Aspergillus terreus]GFF18451.1 hypothetical protein ATEIFO6365_0008039500 [Aspergillus terreus]
MQLLPTVILTLAAVTSAQRSIPCVVGHYYTGSVLRFHHHFRVVDLNAIYQCRRPYFALLVQRCGVGRCYYGNCEYWWDRLLEKPMENEFSPVEGNGLAAVEDNELHEEVQN